MSSRILFRSLQSGHQRSGTSRTLVQARWSDWSHLRPYNDTDDIRDIAWSRIRSEGLSVRSRENQGDYDIMSCWWSTIYDEFWIHNPSESRSRAILRSRDAIETSARFWQYQYSEHDGSTGLHNILKTKPKNALIFVSNIELSDEIRILAHHNDVVYIDFIHPYEKDPDSMVLFSGEVIDRDQYLLAYRATQASKKETLRKMKVSYIEASTTSDITATLNIFFKKRYTHG